MNMFLGWQRIGATVGSHNHGGVNLRCFRFILLLAFGASGAGLFGCANYHVGNHTLYRPDIRTVHVPIFQSDSLRRHLGERLTEMVVKKIEDRTPYKVTSGPGADSVLSGRIISDQKYVVAENANDEPRDIELEFRVEVLWNDHRGNLIAPAYATSLPGELTTFGQAVHLVPEGGQSVATAQLEALERLAEQIVAAMEVPW